MEKMSAYILFITLALVSCQSQIQPLTETDIVGPQDDNMAPEPTLVSGLQLELADPDWDGKQIPRNQICQRFGGENPSTPRIWVGNLPDSTDAIVLEFSDRDYAPMNNGGHGKIGFIIMEGSSEVEIRSILGHTFDLPEGFFLIQEHQAPSFDTAGAYMPPCSGGLGNTYYVTVKAVEMVSMEDKEFNVLEQGILEFGKY